MDTVATHVAEFFRGAGYARRYVAKEGPSYARQRIIPLCLGILLTCILLGLALAPLRLWFRVVDWCANTFHMAFIGNKLQDFRQKLESLNLLYITFWYVPVLALYLGQFLRIFGKTDAFWDNLRSLDFNQYKILHDRKKQQGIRETIGFNLRLYTGGLVIVLLKLFPIFNYITPLLWIFYRLYLRVYKVAPLASAATEIALASIVLAMALSPEFTQVVAIFAQLWLTSLLLAREALAEYFNRCNRKEERRISYYHRFALAGFGSVMLLLLCVPFIGFAVYPAFLSAAAPLVVYMLKNPSELEEEKQKKKQ